MSSPLLLETPRALRRACTWGLVMGLATLGSARFSSGSPSATQGEWKLEPTDRPGQVQMELHSSWQNGSSQGSSTNSFGIAKSDLFGRGSSDGHDVDFSLVRDAGRLHFRGELRQHGERGSGEYTFEPDPAFTAELERMGFRRVQPDDLMRLCLHDIGREWIRGFSRQADRLTVDDLVRFKVHDVSPAFVDAMAASGYRDLSADDLVRLKVHDVSIDYVRTLGNLGYDRPSADDLVRLKVHGVEPSYVRELLALADPRPSIDDMVRLHVHGVEPGYVREFRSLGYERLAADDLVRLKVHGVSPSDARRARARYGEISADELIRLKTRGAI